MYRAIVFDFFDVIHADPFHQWLGRHGYERTGKFEESSRRLDKGIISDEGFYRELGELSGRSAESVRAVFSQTDQIDKELVKLIAGLRGHYKLGLLSNSSGPYLRPILDEHGLTELFDAIAISAEVGLIKPEPEIFQHILEELGVDAAEAVFIDDNPRNIEGAKRLGIRGVVYTGEAALRAELARLGIEVA